MAKKKNATKGIVGDIIGVSISSAVVNASGTTGTTRTMLNLLPTVQAANSLKKRLK